MKGRTLKSYALIWVVISSMGFRFLFAFIVRQFVAIVVESSRLSFEDVSGVASVLDFLSQAVSRNHCGWRLDLAM